LRFGTIWQRERGCEVASWLLAGYGCGQETSAQRFSKEATPLNALDRLVANPVGALAVLSLAAFLEAWGDSFFQVGFYRASGMGRVLALIAGAAVLATYGSVVNIPRWDFGRLLGAYVALFFVMAQILNRVRFGQSPTPNIYAGGALIVAGGLVVMFWKG
jgi:small multidrug resistance family-3 protein